MTELTAGTRGSALAQKQTEIVTGLLLDVYPELTINRKIIKTKGDRILDVSLAKIPGKGLFTKELEVHLLEGTIDFAVHSLKDMPGELPDGLVLGAFLKRQDVEDVLISRDNIPLEQLKEGAVIGTGSARRRQQLARVRPDLQFADIRGNIDTRIGKLEKETEPYDAIILAKAGLKRLGLTDKITQVLPAETVMPAAGQGIIAVECKDEKKILDLFAPLNDTGSCLCALAERALLEELGGGCQTPAACVTEYDSSRITITARYMPDTSLFLEQKVSMDIKTYSDAAQAGRQAARQLLDEYKLKK